MEKTHKKTEKIKKGFLDFNTINIKSYYPVLTVKYKKDILLIDGVKRLKNAKDLIVIGEIKKETEQVKKWLEINTKHRKINELEKAYLIHSLSKKHSNLEIHNLLSKYFNLSIDFIDTYKKYTKFSKNIKNYIAINSPSINIVRVLLMLPEPIIKELDKIINIEINPGTLKNLIELSLDIYIRDKINVFTMPEFIKLLNQSGIKDAINFIKKIRFKNLEFRKDKIDKIIKELKLEKIKISFDNFFEKPFFEIITTIKEANDISLIKKDLEKIDLEKIKEALLLYNKD